MTEPLPADEIPPEPAPRGPKGLIGPTVVGMALGIAIILVLLWLR